MKKTLLTLLALSLSLNVSAANPFILTPTQAGIKEPAEGTSDYRDMMFERRDMDQAIATAALGDNKLQVTLKNVPQYIAIMNDFVMDEYVLPSTNYYALNEWLINTMGIANSPADLKGIKPFLHEVIKKQPNLKAYATKLLKGPFAPSEEEIFANSASERAAFLQMFQ